MRGLAAGLALLTALIVAIATLPATWMAAAFTRWVVPSERVILADASGSLWSGQCVLVLSDGRQRFAVPGRLHWRIAAWPLLTGQLALELQHPALNTAVQMQVSSQWRVSAGGLQLPADVLSGLGAPFNTLRPQGMLDLSWSALHGTLGETPSVFGTTTLLWHQAASRLTPVRPLGSYRVLASGQGADVQLTLTTLQGPLQLQGKGRWSPKQGVAFEGAAFTETALRPQLDSLIDLLGPRTGERVLLKY